MNKNLKLLILEDYENDALLVTNVLKKDGYNLDWQRVESADAMKNSLSNDSFDLIISDYTMPQFNALDALEIMKQQSIDLPFIVVSGEISEETAVTAMKAGAHDFFSKDNLTRLGAAVEREVKEANNRKEKMWSDEKLQQFRSLLDQSFDSIFIIDPKTGSFVDINETACRELEYCKEEMLKMTVLDITKTLTTFEQWNKHVENVVKLGSIIFQADHVRKNGTVFPVEISIKYNNNYIVAIARDISKRIEAEKEKILLHKQIFHSSKLTSIGELSTSIAHEINNPLSIIKGYFSIIEKKIDKNDFDILPIIEIQKKATNRIEDIVHGLRSCARFDDDISESIMINTAIEESLSLFKVVYEKEGIEFDLDFCDERLNINGHAGKFHQVVTNLISNARDATEGQSKRKISITTQKDENNAIITIKDNGKGIEKNNLAKIFKTFFTTKSLGKGAGLGLVIVNNIISNFDGLIDVSSIIEEGTTFRIELPLNEEEKQKVNIDNQEFVFERLSGKALLVDDEEDIRFILSELLTSWGLEVDQSENGQQGLDQIKDNNYDYVITDLQMPIMGGEEFLFQLKKISTCKAKTFIISGSMINNVNDCQADGIIEKPFREEAIYKTLLQNASVK